MVSIFFSFWSKVSVINLELDKQGCPDISLLSQECLECIRDETAALNADKFFAVDYLVSLLSKIGSSNLIIFRFHKILLLTFFVDITFLNSFASISSTCAHLFYEFPNRAQQSIASVSLELLLLPVDEKTLANALIRILIEGALPQRHSIAKLLLSLAILVNTLPLSFGHAIWERIVSLLTHESLNIIQRQVDNDPRVFDFSKLDLIADSNIWSALLVPDVDNIGRYGLQTTLGKLLMLTHAIFHYDSGRQSQFYSYIISLIERLSIRQWNNNIPSTAAIHQLRYLCKLICPIAIYVKAINSTLFTKFTLFVLDQLSEIAKICGLVRSPEVIIQYRKDEEINEALQPVFDLLCWLMLKQNFSDFGTIADIKIKHSNLPDIWRKQISLPGSILLV